MGWGTWLLKKTCTSTITHPWKSPFGLFVICCWFIKILSNLQFTWQDGGSSLQWWMSSHHLQSWRCLRLQQWSAQKHLMRRESEIRVFKLDGSSPPLLNCRRDTIRTTQTISTAIKISTSKQFSLLKQSAQQSQLQSSLQTITTQKCSLESQSAHHIQSALCAHSQAKLNSFNTNSL